MANTAHTEAVATYIRDTYHWEWRGVSRPPLPLPDDYMSLYPHFDHAKAEEMAQDIVQATFYIMVAEHALTKDITAPVNVQMIKMCLVSLVWSVAEQWITQFRPAILAANAQRSGDQESESEQEGAPSISSNDDV